ncbi:MAG: hypothetical protein ABIZ04_13435 [Opitutus sp.]
MPIKCQTCAAAIAAPHSKIGMRVQCPACGAPTVLTYEIGTRIPPNGWFLTFADFAQLFSDASYQTRIGEMIERWFGCKIIIVDERVQFKRPDESLLIYEHVHDSIQADPEKQYQLYQAAMDLWR